MKPRAKARAPSAARQLKAIRALLVRCLADGVSTREQLGKLSAKLDRMAGGRHERAST